MDRRRYLATLVTVPATTLAGCTDEGSTDTEGNAATDATTATDTDTATDTATTTETATDTAAATDTASPTDTAAATDTQSATDSPTAGTTTTRTASQTASPTPTEAVPTEQTVQVAPGSFRFDPRSFEIAVGGTVEWVWEADGHNVAVVSQPEGSEWTGTPGNDLYDAGYTHEYTFEVPGTYEYQCDPHQGIGMVGSFTVVE